MKKLFRKATAIAGNFALIGATVGMAAAASYPEPFTANTAIVVGANAAPSDNIAAASLASDLDANAAGGASVTVTGGESFMLDKSSDHFNFNDDLDAVHATLDDNDMDFLADGTYDDGDIDEDYEQTIALSDKTLSFFADNDYNDDTPTVGFKWTNNENILSYTLEYDSTISFDDMEDTDLPLLGGEYYVLDSTSAADTLELLDSAEKTVLAEGETVTVGAHTVMIEYIDDGEVKFNVNGEITDKLMDHESYELDDGFYIVANEVLFASKDSGVSKAEFSIGAGKLVLQDGEEVEENDEDIDGLVATFALSGDDLTSITLAWNSDDETFLTEDNPVEMPGFGGLSLAFGGLTYGDESEMVELEHGETFTVSMGNYDLPLMWWDESSTTLGEEDYELLRTTAAVAAGYTGDGANTSALTGGMEFVEDNRFIVTYVDTDLSDVETLYYEVTTVDNDSTGSDLSIELKDLIGDDDMEFTSVGDEEERGDITVTLLGADEDNAYFTFTESGDGDLAYNRAVSETGLVLTWPDVSSVDDTTSADLTWREADEDGDLNAGATFTTSVIVTSNDKIHVSGTSVTMQEASDENFEGIVPSDLASKLMSDETGDEYEFSIEYFGEETTADVSVVAGGEAEEVVDAGVMTVKDSEVATVADKNLVVVGGSAINSVAAELLGGAYSEAEFTSMTDVAAGEFLIQSFERAGKTALLVAGYNAADTEKAVTYLLNEDVDTTVGMKYKGMSATEATLVTA